MGKFLNYVTSWSEKVWGATARAEHRVDTEEEATAEEPEKLGEEVQVWQSSSEAHPPPPKPVHPHTGEDIEVWKR